MKLHIKQIRPDGLELNESFPPEWAGLTRKDSIRFEGPISIKALVTRADEEIIVNIDAKSFWESFCSRCLNDQSSDWAASFELIFDIDKGMEFIDISEDIRQELVLKLPSRVLCGEDCKGLCIDCGVNLNKNECEHMHSVASSV